MSRSTRFSWVAVAAVTAAAAFAPAAFGSFSDRPEAGEPPMGVAYQSDAQGAKLSGVLSIELLDVAVVGNVRTADGGARAVLRLRKGGEGPRGYSTSLAGPIPFSTPQDIADLQAELLAIFREPILSGVIGFFGDECGPAGTDCPEVTITPKGFDESVVVVTSDGSDALYFVSDLDLAVK